MRSKLSRLVRPVTRLSTAATLLCAMAGLGKAATCSQIVELTAHPHADALAIEYAVEGKAWLIDPGTFTYTGDADLRDQFRSTKAHNTVTVDGQPQSVPAGPFGWKHIAKSSPKQFITEE